MFFGPQKVLAHGPCASRDYSRKKVIPISAVIAAGAEAAVLKSYVLIRTGKGRYVPAFR
jgi:hypothetical protein